MFKAVNFWVITKQKIIKFGAIILAIGAIIVLISVFLKRNQPVFNFSKPTQWPNTDVYELNVEAGAQRELPIYSVERDDNKIAITVDAAWEDSRTAELLNIFKSNDVKATFFLCKYWVENCPDFVKQIHEEGHQLGNHSATHPHMSKLSAAEIKKELTDTDDAIEKLIGTRSTMFRPPFGEYDNNVINAARSAGYEVIQWSIDTIDWQNDRSVDFIVKRVLDNVKSGDIILCHNNAQYVLDYMPIIIKELKNRGFEFVTVEELLLQGDTTINSQGIQQPATQSEAANN